MPTENRSRNTELAVQHPQGRRERFQKWVLSTKHPVLGYLDGTWLARGDDREGYADKYVQGLWVAFKQFDQPAPQPHPEPLAWMVGTAFWWTKEEAERDAAATGLPITCLGPMTDAAEVERLRAALKFYADREHYHFESGNWDTVSGEPLNILWCGDEPDFIEDGTVARAALERQP